MDELRLQADCPRCAALCCVALAFDRSEMFGFDKAAGETCRHLDAAGGCAVHAERARLGFQGCIAFECQGAGQYVTQVMFGGRSWRREPALLQPMMAAFSALRAAHDQLALLRQARALPLPADRLQRIAELERTLHPPDGWTPADVAAGRVEAACEEARRFLRSLSPFAARARGRPDA